MRFIGIFCGSVLLFFSLALKAQEDFKSEDELKAKAQELFQNQELVKAEPLYARLLSLYPKDPEYNFKYGACLLAADGDKEKPLKYLQFASSKSGVDPLSYYYLGRVHHLNYNFGLAVKAYSKFKNKASSDDREKYQVERQIEMCKNGNALLSKLNEVQVLDKQTISEKDFFRIYDLKGIDGKIITKPEEFKSKYDKKIGENSIIYLPNSAKEVYYSSYGKKGEAGRDLYRVVKLGNDSWSDPVNLGPSINTPYDENYAFIHPDGRTLYFASKGHSSMGGYDLFKSTYDDAINDWTAPVNLDFAFSSVDDDVLFITDEDKVLAFFASNRGNAEGKFTVYKVRVDKAPADVSVIQGKFIAENNPNLTKAKITVIDQATNQTIGVYETDENGNYQVEINDNGGTYKFNIETTASAPIHTGIVNVPKQSEFEVLGQELRLVGTGDDQQLVIKNIFDGTASPRNASSPQISSELLRKKASLEVNLSASDLLALQGDSQSGSAKEASANNKNPGNTSGSGNAEKPSGNNQSSDQSNSGNQSASTENSASNTNNPASSSAETGVENSGQDLADNSLGNNNSDVSNPAQANANAGNLAGQVNSGSSAKVNAFTADLNNLSAEVKSDLEENKKAETYAYQQAGKLSSSASKLFDEVKAKKSSGTADESSYKADEEEAERLALQSAFALKFAQNIEENTKAKAERLKQIEALEEQISSGSEISSADQQKLNELKAESSRDLDIKESLSQAKKATQNEILFNAEMIASVGSKKESFESEQTKLDNQIKVLEEEKASANEERKAEIDKLIAGYELDKQDMAYQIENAQKQYDNALAKESALQVKLEQIEMMESEYASTDVEAQSLSAEEKTKLNSEVKAFIDSESLAYDSEELNTSGVGLTFEKASTSAGLVDNSSQIPSTGTPVSGKAISQINSYYETELVLADKQIDPDIQKARKIETYNQWLKDLENRRKILEQSDQSGDNSSSSAEQLAIADQINSVKGQKSILENQLEANAESPSATNEGEQSITDSQAANQVGGELANNTENTSNPASGNNNTNNTNNTRAARPKADPSAYSASESVGNVDVSSVNEQSIIPEGFTSFNMDQDFRYTNPQIVGSLSAAKKAYAAAAAYGKKAQDARAAAYNLETTEERNQAFNKALEYEKAGRTKEVEAAKLLGEANAREYTKNSAQLANVAIYADEYDSQNLDIANLLNEEAAVYYNKALEERANVEPETRLALQETQLQKAYDYEMLALKKQKEALKLLKIADQELQANTTGSVFELNDVVETPIAQDLNSAATAGATTGAIQVVQPADVSTDLRIVNLDTVNINEARRSIVINSNTYKNYLSEANRREQARKAADIDYELAVQKENKRQQLIKEAQVLRADAEATDDPEEKARLIKSAEVIDQEVALLSTEIGNLNASIQANNLIVEEAEIKMEETLANLSTQERLEIQKITSENIEASPAFASNGTSNRLAANENSGSGQQGSQAQSRSGQELPNLNSENSNVDADATNNINSGGSSANIDVIPRVVKQAIFVKLSPTESAYDDAKPIPVNPKMPEGLVYKVQVGAFRNPIPQDLFKGFAPLMAEKVPNGITRYTAGIFVNEREAVGVRNQIRQLGYPDAFVVAFLNGKRISIAQARQRDRSAEGLADADSRGLSSSSNATQRSTSNVPLVSGGSSEGLSSTVKAAAAGNVKNAASISGLYFTVQIGVYSKAVPAGQFASYKDVNVIELDNGLTRYNTGIFDNAVDANQLKNQISAAIKDAFVVAYYNGKRISLAEAARIANQN